MRDLIDLGNLVFDRLVEVHSELPESRTLFLYGITQGSTWTVIGTNKQLTITQEGVYKNFEDRVIETHHLTWTDLINSARKKKADAEVRKLKEEPKQFKDGDVIDFWKDEGPWREINIGL